jgi:hypothetical protein
MTDPAVPVPVAVVPEPPAVVPAVPCTPLTFVESDPGGVCVTFF